MIDLYSQREHFYKSKINWDFCPLHENFAPKWQWLGEQHHECGVWKFIKQNNND